MIDGKYTFYPGNEYRKVLSVFTVFLDTSVFERN